MVEDAQARIEAKTRSGESQEGALGAVPPGDQDIRSLNRELTGLQRQMMDRTLSKEVHRELQEDADRCAHLLIRVSNASPPLVGVDFVLCVVAELRIKYRY